MHGPCGRGAAPQADERGEELIFLSGQDVLGETGSLETWQGGTAVPTSRARAHLFSMACRNSSKVRKGVPSPQMPRRLMYIMLRGSEAPRGWKPEVEASGSPHSWEVLRGIWRLSGPQCCSPRDSGAKGEELRL